MSPLSAWIMQHPILFLLCLLLAYACVAVTLLLFLAGAHRGDDE
jgi:hypothetical protein